jgi:hypothetical protein
VIIIANETDFFILLLALYKAMAVHLMQICYQLVVKVHVYGLRFTQRAALSYLECPFDPLTYISCGCFYFKADRQ